MYSQRSIFTTAITLMFCTFAQAQLPCGQNIDFNTWNQEGDPTSGLWNVTNGGNSVEQNINGVGTWFVSPNDFFNVTIQGSIQVNTSADDDLVGFVFGYQAPIGPLTNPSSTYVKTFFFDWKQETQTFVGMTSNEGFALYEMDGLFDFTNIVSQGTGSVHPELWERVNSPILNVLDTDYGNNGWNDFQQYDFQLKYTADSIIIWIDNQLIFAESGCFEPGRFGFYNQSQDDVIYSNFSYNFEYDFTISDTILCVNDSSFFEIGSGCLNSFQPNNTFDWDFGDNTTTTGIDPNHVYSTSGVYDIQLITSNSTGCIDTATVSIEVFDYPNPNAGLDDTSCVLTYNLNAAPGNGSWIIPVGITISNPTDPNATVTAAAAGSYSFVWEMTTPAGCNGADTVTVLFNDFTISSTVTDPLCFGQLGTIGLNVQGGNGNYSYQWGISSGSQTTASAINLVDGPHTVEITLDAVCVEVLNFTITEPAELIIAQISSVAACIGDNVTLSVTANGGTSPYTYSWGNGLGSSSTALVTVNQAISIPITITDANGCVVQDTAEISILPSPNASFDVDPLEACLGAEQIFTFINTSNPQGFTAEWNLGDQSTAIGDTVTHVYSTEGLYSVTISIASGFGCNDSFTDIDVIQIFPDPTAAFAYAPSPLTIINPSAAFTDLSYSAINIWNWTFDALDTSTEQNPNFTFPSSEGHYLITLEVENMYGCTDSISELIQVNGDLSIFAPNTFTPNSDAFNNDWRIFINGLDIYNTEIRIYNRWGELIWLSYDVSVPWDGTYGGVIVPYGIYTWHVQSKSIATDEKFEFSGHINVLR